MSSPSFTHDALVELFANCPELAATLVHDVLRVELPAFEHAEIRRAELTQLVCRPNTAPISSLSVTAPPAPRSPLSSKRSSKRTMENYEYQSPWVKKWNRLQAEAEQAKAEGEARTLVRIIEKRGLALTDAQRARITACKDIATLDGWTDRVLTVTSVDELLSEPR